MHSVARRLGESMARKPSRYSVPSISVCLDDIQDGSSARRDTRKRSRAARARQGQTLPLWQSRTNWSSEWAKWQHRAQCCGHWVLRGPERSWRGNEPFWHASEWFDDRWRCALCLVVRPAEHSGGCGRASRCPGAMPRATSVLVGEDEKAGHFLFAARVNGVLGAAGVLLTLRRVPTVSPTSFATLVLAVARTSSGCAASPHPRWATSHAGVSD